MTQALQELDRINRQDNIKAIEALKNQGIKFITPSRDQMAEWTATATKASQELINAENLPKAPADKVTALLEQYRKTNNSHGRTRSIGTDPPIINIKMIR